MNTMTIAEFLTDAQIEAALKLYNRYGHWDSVERIESEVIAPNMAAINAKLGQQNDARYLAYVVVYVFLQVQSQEDQVN